MEFYLLNLDENITLISSIKMRQGSSGQGRMTSLWDFLLLNVGIIAIMISDLKAMVNVVKSRAFDSCRILCSAKE